MTISKFLNNLLVVITILAFCAQLFIDFSTINVATSSIILFSGLSTILYFRWTKSLDTHPLSSFAIFGFCITSILGALLAQSASWTSVSGDLWQPLVTFVTLSSYQAIAIIAHCFYRLIDNSKLTENPGLVRKVFEVLGVYDTPSVYVLWLVGIFGLFCVLLAFIFPVANGFSYLAWTPFLIPIYRAQNGKAYCNIRLNYIFLVLHSIIIALIAILFNTRGIMFSGYATLALLFLLSAMLSKKLINATILFRFAIVLVIGLAMAIPASNMATAIALSREGRGKMSPIKIFKNTFENFNSPEKLEKFSQRRMIESMRSAYDEKYIANPVVARLVTTKFHDNAIYYAGKVSDKERETLTKVTQDFFWTLMPQPFLDLLKIGINKKDYQFTMGDMLANFVAGVPLNSYRTGSIFGQGFVIFGNLFLVVYFALCFILFASIDIFSKRLANGVVLLSVIGMLNLWPNFIFGVTSDSFLALLSGVFRGIFQSVLLYFIAFSIAKFITKAFNIQSIFKTTYVIE